MKIEFTRHDIEIPYLVEKLIERKVHKLKNLLRNHQTENVSLHIDLSGTEKKEIFEIKLSLNMPGAVLTSGDSHETLVGACGNAFSKLFISVEQFKHALRRGTEFAKKKSDSMKVISGAEHPTLPQEQLAEFFSKSYHKFFNYGLREIRFRCYGGFVKPGTIALRDILDDALANAASRMNGKYSDNLARRLCYDEIRKSIDRHLNLGGIGMVPLEKTIEPEVIEREYEEYYQADEIIKVEDIIIDENAEIPDKKVEYHEIETYIDRLLSQLPADWREAFVLVVREGLPPDDLAKSRQKSVESVLKDIAMAKEFIKNKLIDAGFAWKDQSPRNNLVT